MRGHTPVLSDADIDAIPIEIFMAAIRHHLVADARGAAIAPPRHYAEFPAGAIAFTIGGNHQIAGFRAYESFAAPARAAEDQIVAVWDQSNCRLKAVAIGNRLGAARTGALGGIAVDILAPRGAAVCGVVGSGLQAEAQIVAIAAVRQLAAVRIYSPNAEKRAALADRLERRGLPARATVTAKACVDAAEIVVLATNSSAPVIEPDWISPNAHVTTLGPKLKTAHELPPEIARRARVIVSDSPQQIAAQGDRHLLHGTLEIDRIAHLGALADGFDPDAGRGMTLYLSAGLAGSEVVALDAAAGWLKR
jgi:ornithine cyclodeaminase